MPGFSYKFIFFAMASVQALILICFSMMMFRTNNEQPKGILAKRDLYRISNKSDRTKQEDEKHDRFNQDSRELDDSLSRQSDSSLRSPRDSEDSANRGYSERNASFNSDQASDIPRLFIAIISAQNYTDRRQAIRETWMQECDAERKVLCKFFTDALNERGDPIDSSLMEKLEDESMKNRNDLIMLDTPSGLNFALRLLAVMDWAKENVHFDYLLRIDDDNFLCLDRLIEELPFRPRKRLYWGYLHCQQGQTRIDEGMMILTSDLVDEFLRDKDKLLCHKFADQAVAMWIYESMKKKPITWFGDYRIHHDPPASFVREFRRRDEICRTFLSLHGSYPKDMTKFQEIVSRERRKFESSYDIPPVIDNCPYSRDHFHWEMMHGRFLATPIPCRDEPTWVRASSYIGRLKE